MWWVASPLRGLMSHLTQQGAFEQFPITRQDLSAHPSIQLALWFTEGNHRVGGGVFPPRIPSFFRADPDISGSQQSGQGLSVEHHQSGCGLENTPTCLPLLSTPLQERRCV